MFKKSLFLIALLACLMAVPAFAAEKASTLGVPNSSGSYALEVDTDNVITINGQLMSKYEVVTTSDTLTAAESGTIYFVSPSSQMTFTLPDAEAGLIYKFVQAAGNANGLKKMIIDPQDTDTLVGCVNSSAATTFAAGDSLISTTATGDSITLVGGSSTWYCVDRIGTFVDNN